MGKCRVGFVGLGHVAQVGHLPGSRNAQKIEVVAGSDIREDVLKKVSQEWGFPGYPDFEEMLRKENLDFLCITTGPRWTRPITEKAAEHGVHVLVEKPMAMTLDDGRAMIRECRKHGVKLFYGETYRFLPTIRKAKEMIEAGLLGEVSLLMEILVGGSGPQGFELYQIYPPGAPGAGGSGLTDHGIHLVDIFRWLTGSEAEWVFGRGTRAGARPDTEFLTMKLKNGAIGELVYHEATFPAELPSEGIFSWGAYLSAGRSTWESSPTNLRIHGTKGALRIFPYSNKMYHFSCRGAEEIRVPDKPHPAHFGLQLDSFAESLKKNSEPEVTGLDGLIALQIILAAYESYETQRIVPISRLAV
jgi:predicted dehydrogenase